VNYKYDSNFFPFILYEVIFWHSYFYYRSLPCTKNENRSHNMKRNVRVSTDPMFTSVMFTPHTGGASNFLVGRNYSAMVFIRFTQLKVYYQ